MKIFRKGKLSRTLKFFIMLAIFLSLAYFFVFFLSHRHESNKITLSKQLPPDSSVSVAWITDIHADKKISREEGGNVIYPSNYKKCLEQILALKTDLIIATGDNTDKGKASYYEDLKSITEGKNFIWVKGNHDSDDFQILARNNYYFDYKNWRIIVLDTSEQFSSSTGYLDDSRITFLKDSLNIDKNIIIAMHHPPFFYNSRANIYTRDKIPLYDNFFNALTPNVKYVLTGHWHYDIGTEINGVQYLTEKALTQDGICNYKIINLSK